MTMTDPILAPYTPPKSLEQMTAQLLGDARATIGYTEKPVPAESNRNFRTGRRVPHRVLNEVACDLCDGLIGCHHHLRILLHLEGESDVGRRGKMSKRLCGPAHQGRHVHWLDMPMIAAFEPRQAQ